jgi:hypothetical protein
MQAMQTTSRATATRSRNAIPRPTRFCGSRPGHAERRRHAYDPPTVEPYEID